MSATADEQFGRFLWHCGGCECIDRMSDFHSGGSEWLDRGLNFHFGGSLNKICEKDITGHYNKLKLNFITYFKLLPSKQADH